MNKAYTIVHEILLKEVKNFSGKALTWNHLLSYLRNIHDSKILNTTVVMMEHHHFVHLRCQPEIKLVKGIYMLDAKYENNSLKDSMTYSMLLEQISKIPSKIYNKPVSIVDTEVNDLYLYPEITTALEDYEANVKEINNNKRRVGQDRQDDLDYINNEFKRKFEKDGDDVDYFLEHEKQPILSINDSRWHGP